MKRFSFFCAIFFFTQFDASAQPHLYWASIYNGTGNGLDAALAITLDAFGNVYITGGSAGVIGSGRDIVTIKYNSLGQQQWAHRFNGIENGDDLSRGIILDENNNIYISGNYVIKYNKISGDTIWTKRYSYIGNFGEVINIDSNQHIYISGGTLNGIGISKLDTNGLLIWQRFIHGFGGGYDIVNSQHIDEHGKIIVSGYTRKNTGAFDQDAIIAKYDQNGDTLWVRIFHNIADTTRPNDFAYASAIDDSGNIVITGITNFESSSKIPFDCLIVKYRPNGDTAWTRIYGTLNNGEAGYDIKTDSKGDIYIAGRQNIGANFLVKYSSSGLLLWSVLEHTNNFNMRPKLTVDKNDNIYLAFDRNRPPFGSDVVLNKYNSAGNLLWTTKYPGGTVVGFGAPFGILTDKENVYITGTGPGPGGDYLTLKFSQTVGINQISSSIPQNYKLNQNYPNPFNPVTNITFELPKNEFVTLTVYDLTGRELTKLVNQNLKAGVYNYSLELANASSGIFYYTLTAGKYRETKKMILLK